MRCRMQKSEIRTRAREELFLHQVTRVGLDYQPHLPAFRPFQGITRCEGQVDFHLDAAIHARGNNHVASFERYDTAANPLAAAPPHRLSVCDETVAPPYSNAQ